MDADGDFFLDTVSKEPEEYFVVPQFGDSVEEYKVYITPDIKSGHDSSSHHPADTHPTVYWAIGEVVKNPTKRFASSSKDSGAQKLSKYGHVEVYEKHELFESLNIPGYVDQYPHHKMVVPVFYPYDTNQRNTARTFYIVPQARGMK